MQTAVHKQYVHTVVEKRLYFTRWATLFFHHFRYFLFYFQCIHTSNGTAIFPVITFKIWIRFRNEYLKIVQKTLTKKKIEDTEKKI